MPADIELHRGSAPAGWDDMVRGLGGSVFHSSLWAEYQQRARRVEPLFAVHRGPGGAVRGAALALLGRPRRRIAALLNRSLELPAHPAMAADESADPGAFLRQLEALARRLGCVRLQLGSFMSGQSRLVPGAHGYAEHERLEFTVDLTGDLDELWRAIRKDQRERVRRLGREGVSVETGTQLQDLHGLRAAREATRQRRAEHGQGYTLDADETFYESLYEHLIKAGAARLLVARRAGEVIAALFLATWNGRACSIFSGSTDAGYRLGAQSGLFWAAVEAFKAEGFRELNRGGLPASAASEADPLHGIYQFKSRLGTTPRLCRSGEKIISPTRDRLHRLGGSLRRLASGA